MIRSWLISPMKLLVQGLLRFGGHPRRFIARLQPGMIWILGYRQLGKSLAVWTAHGSQGW